MKKIVNIIITLTLAISANACHAKPEQAVRYRALVIGIDGMKGNAFYQHVMSKPTPTPNLFDIASHGQYSQCTSITDKHCARTHLGPRFAADYSWETSSGWATVITGVNTNKHLVKGNGYDSQAIFFNITQSYPSFLKQLKDRGFHTAIAGVGCFISSLNDQASNAHVSTGITDFECGLNIKARQSSVDALATQSCNATWRLSLDGSNEQRDAQLARWMLQMVNDDSAQSPDVVMGVFDTADEAGHHFGYDANPGYLAALSQIDRYLTNVLQAINDRVKTRHEAWLILVTSDHGGHTKQNGHGAHGETYDDDEVIPFMIAVYSDTIHLKQQGMIDSTDIKQMDISPSLLHWFGVTAGKNDGTNRCMVEGKSPSDIVKPH